MRTIKRQTGVRIAAFLLAAGIGCLTQGATVYVSKTGSHTPPFDTWVKAATNISAAVSAAQDGDTVLVGNGQYLLTEAVNIERGSAVRSQNGYHTTEVNGQNTVRCFELRHASAVLEGLTIANGNTAGSGGGVWMNAGLVNDCSITGNYAQLFGGGVNIYGNGVVSNCVVSYNRTPINAGGCGGGVACSYGGTLVDSTLGYNEASHGGGVYMFADTVVDGCTIFSNLSWDTAGGGVGSGGGAELNGTNIVLRRCVIAENLSQESAGGVYLSGHTGQKVRNCLIRDNVTDWFGGGVYVNLSADPYTIESCTIVGNHATNEFFGMGGGVCSGSGQAISFRNNIMYFNSAAFAGDNYHVVDGGPVNGEYNCTSPGLPGTDNITDDPLFQEVGSANFRLASGSPCIDSGTNQGWMATARDLDNKTRILNNVVDRGAYEYGTEPGVSNIVLRILTPYAGQVYSTPADVHCDLRVEQWGGPGITQTVVTINGNLIDQQVWTNAEQYCMIFVTYSNVIAGTYTITLQAWDVAGTTASTSRFFSAESRHYCSDYNGDGMSDLAVFDSNTGAWYAETVSATTLMWQVSWGWAGAIPVEGDYDGNGISDLAVFDSNTGNWYIQSVAGATLAWAVPWGWPGAKPVSGDYDGDGRSDLAVFDNNTGNWYVQTLAGTVVAWAIPWGWPGAVPVPGDYDGDDKADLAVFDGNTGAWYAKTISGNTLMWQVSWGWVGAVPVAGDYDGDGIADLAVFDGNTGNWYIQTVAGVNIAWALNWGWPGAIAVAGDYDGDDVADIAVFDGTSGNWYIRTVSGTILAWQISWGWPGAIAVCPGSSCR